MKLVFRIRDLCDPVSDNAVLYKPGVLEFSCIVDRRSWAPVERTLVLTTQPVAPRVREEWNR